MLPKPRPARIVGVALAFACACAGAQNQSQWEDRAVLSLRLAVAPAAPGEDAAEGRLRAALERAVRSEGFRAVDVQGPDGVLSVKLGQADAAISLVGRAGEAIADASLPRPAGDPDLDALALALLKQIEWRSMTQTYARSGVVGPPH